jgi:ubiquinone/menaquinone biosynthesis C-methylase UbiE
MALWIAEEVTDRGAVWAVDASAQQLAIARGQAEARNFTWIRFVESEIDRLDLVPNDLDFVYVRCLLMHLRDPLGALERMKSCLQRGGTLAIQEPISSTAYSIPTQPVFEKLNRTLAAIALAKGVDFDVGRSLPELVHKAGFRDVKLYYTQRAVDMATMKRLLILGIQESASAAMGTGAATQAELTAWVNEVSGMDESPDRYYVLPSQAHITARVP